MNELGLPPLHSVELVVMFGAFLLFSFLPATLSWSESLRERRATALAQTAALRALAAQEPAVIPPDTSSSEIHETPVSAEAVVAMESDVSLSPISEPQVEEVVVEPQPVPAPVPDEPAGAGYEFRLDDLRRARVLESPRQEVFADPAHQREWEEGLKLAETHAATIGSTSLTASFEPQARCFAGAHDLGETKELRFLLFPTLWPTSTDQAVGLAVFELGGEGIVRARVFRA